MNPKIRLNDEEIKIIEEDEEKDLEKQLNYKITWEIIFKVIFVTMIVAVVVYYSIMGAFPSDIYVYILLIVFIIGGAILISLDFEEEVYNQTISVLTCRSCSFQKINSFSDGDYIFKMKGNCPNCDGHIQITEIYSIKLKEKIKEEKVEI